MVAVHPQLVAAREHPRVLVRVRVRVKVRVRVS